MKLQFFPRLSGREELGLHMEFRRFLVPAIREIFFFISQTLQLGNRFFNRRKNRRIEVVEFLQERSIIPGIPDGASSSDNVADPHLGIIDPHAEKSVDRSDLFSKYLAGDQHTL